MRSVSFPRRRRLAFAGLAAAAVALGLIVWPRPDVPARDYGGVALQLATRAGTLKGLAFRGAQAPDGTLIFVLHGDAPFDRPGYQYVFAARAAAALPHTTVVALLRPGYEDPTGDRSDGWKGLTTGDNYGPGAVDAIADAIRAVTAREHAQRVILVGHSGGAAIAADLLGRHPGIANAALLVGCPCDVPQWRRHMLAKQVNPLWLLPVDSLSPASLAPGIAPGTRIVALVGADDDVAPSALSLAFVAAARAARANAVLELAPGRGHDILLDPEAMAALQATVAAR